MNEAAGGLRIADCGLRIGRRLTTSSPSAPRAEGDSPLATPQSAIRNPQSEVVAILLAAGRSRRMGAFKPLLPFGRGTVAGACVESLRAGGVAEVVVVVGHRAAEVRAALGGAPGVRFAVNDEPESEMGVSVARGVEALGDGAGATLVALVDHPAVPASEIRNIIEARRHTGARLIVPVWEGRGGHPVLVDLALRAELLDLVPRRGLRALFEAHHAEVLRLPAASPFVARDMDTWEDYVALQRDVFGEEPREGVGC